MLPLLALLLSSSTGGASTSTTYSTPLNEKLTAPAQVLTQPSPSINTAYHTSGALQLPEHTYQQIPSNPVNSNLHLIPQFSNRFRTPIVPECPSGILDPIQHPTCPCLSSLVTLLHSSQLQQRQ
uniref:Spore coat polysaccharide biosynthesis protein spsE n=1 Tax=Lygus hesperus TaxID=30085 RepID=A0A0A9WB59_LYGHE